MRVFIDTNIPMYAAGTAHPYREPCRNIIKAITSGSVDAATDAEVFQEILYRYLHINRREQGLMIFDKFQTLMGDGIMPVTMRDVGLARELVVAYPALSPRDLIHVAVMIHHEIRHILSTDRNFDTVKGIMRIDPSEFK
ncbi:twitching motility protein PilT [Clostridiales bacterium PH28_bin88]|nr:twitching motility protein PilT [Clostridiales bacterium PH28_bin88]